MAQQQAPVPQINEHLKNLAPYPPGKPIEAVAERVRRHRYWYDVPR
jgi:hypothetical protein